MTTVVQALLESPWASALVLLVQATLLLVVTAAVSAVLPRRAHAARHLVWALAAGMLLLLPLARWWVPAVEVVVATVPAQSAITGTVAGDVVAAASPAESAPGVVAAHGPARQAAGTAGLAGGGVALPALPYLLWVAGTVAALAWLLAGRVALHVVLRRAEPLRDAGWEELRAEAAWLLAVTRRVQLYRSASASMPVTWGALRPVIVLPADADSWPEARRRVVLLHEMAHVARGDCLTQLVASVACALFWFHPGAWYAAKRMRAERERACDDLVLSLGTSPPDYASHLLGLAQRFRRGFPAPMLALDMARPSQLEGRLLAVLAGPSDRRPPARASVAGAAAAMLALTVAVAAVRPAVAASPAGFADGSAAAVETVVGDVVRAADDGSDTSSPAGDPADASSPAVYPFEPSSPAGDPAGAASAADIGQTLASVVATTLSHTTAAVDTPPARPAMTGNAVLTNGDTVARIVSRVRPADALFAITTTDGKAMMVLRDSTLVLQLTDRGLEEIGRPDQEEERGMLGALLGGMLRGGLRILLDRGIEYSLSDIREVRYDGNRLVFESVRGRREVLGNVNVDGRELMESFSPRDARAFASRATAQARRVQRGR